MRLYELNEKGSVLNIALLIIILLSLVGLGVNRVVTLDNKIGVNVKRSWNKFYEAEGVLREAAQWLEDTSKETLEDKSQPGLYNEVHLMDPGQNYDGTPLGGNNDGKIDEDEMIKPLEETVAFPFGRPLRDNPAALNYNAQGWPMSKWPDPDDPGNAEKRRRFITIDYGVAQGTSIVMNDPSRLHQFIIASRAQDNRSDAIIKAGYLKRY